MKLACIIVAHTSPEQLVLLGRSLQHPEIRIYLHLDRRQKPERFRRALAEAGLKNLAVLPSHAVVRGSAAFADVAIAGLVAGISDGCDYFVLISGQDFPLLSTDEMLAFFADQPSRTYIEHWPLHASRHRFHGRDRTHFYAYNLRSRMELCIPPGEDTSFLSWKGRILNQALRVFSFSKPPRRFPAYAQPFAGATWWNMSRDAADFVLRFLEEHPDYRLYHSHTMAADEVFFHSILLGTEFASHHEVVDDSLRFYRWDGVHARVLTEQDLPAIMESGKLFARKFDAQVDNRVLLRLADRLHG